MRAVTIESRARKRLEDGHPWVFRSSILSTGPELRDGDVADARDERGRFLGRGFYNGRSQIAFRLLTRHDEPVTDSLFAGRLQTAWEYRLRLCDPGCCRVVHSESDFLPGLIADKFGATIVVQTLSLGLERYKTLIADTLMELTGARGVYERNDTPVRALEGLAQAAGPLRGDPDPAPVITENGLRLRVDAAAGQKTGYFLDQRENRAALAPLVPGARVLDCFCHTGSFALHAAMYGAKEATGVDISEAAVALSRGNAAMNGLEGRTAFECRNAFDRLRELASAGERYDVIVLDPPAFAKNRDALPGATRGYKEINLQALRMVRDGGFLVTCSCSHHMPPPLFMDTVRDAARDAGRVLRLVEARTQAKDHPILPGAPETQYLKCLIFQAFS